MKITIYLTPKGQMRARHASRGQFSVTYKDKKQRLEEDKLIALLYEYRPDMPFEGPLALQVHAYLPIAQSKPKKWQVAAMEGKIRPTGKPDLSNIIKHLEDCMNGTFFQDDRQIVALAVEKFYSDRPRWEIQLEPIGGNHG